ncbi:MAG: 5-methylcytosine-specific restriction endonuclease system specificity protein McrC [Lachnospiraceae bacterium]|nr:5-methylcytosine-specific restriction endonuclease system specificity protein McrC [Lachnospiraceae bacterium]
MIKMQNVYYMLSYAFQNLNETAAQQYSSEKFEFIDDLFTAILAKGIAKQVKQGLGKEYIYHTDELSSPTGRINISETIKTRALQKNRICCSVDELLENTYMNQILKSTSLLLLHSNDVAVENKKQLKKVLLFFSNVDTVNCKKIDWGRLQYNRNNVSYKMLMNICYLIVNGMLISDKKGVLKLSRYIDDQQMHSLYEKFILAYYRRHYPEFKVTRSHIPWNTDDEMIELLPRMKSDVMIEYREKTLIIDAKYYNSAMQKNSRYGNRTIHSNNLYQIFTYVKNKDVEHSGNVSGMLLYANTDGENPDQDYQMDGNKISVKTLDLDCDFVEVRKQLDGIVLNWLA